MKLKKVTINNLFNSFVHEIPINDDEGITIIIGENGIGKTVVLEMIKSFFNNDFDCFFQVKFDFLKLYFTDGVEWSIFLETSDPAENDSNEFLNSLCLVEKSPKRKKDKKETLCEQIALKEPYLGMRRHLKRHNRHGYRHNPYLERISFDKWFDHRIGRVLNRKEVQEKYGILLDSSFGKNREIPTWITHRISINKVHLIKTQRLIYLEEDERDDIKKTVDKYSAELSSSIQSLLAQSTEISSNLDRTYPNRLLKLLKSKKKKEITIEALRESFMKLKLRRNLLDKVGLIDFQEETEISLDESNSSAEVMNALQLYVEDSLKKLSIYDEISKKIELFINIINNKFKHKQLIVNKDEGFIFKSKISSNERIPAGSLSSGEQNELVLFYELLFKTEKNSFVLIDEPEISLHISWQNSFIDDLREIIQLNKFDILIATHSPNIIGNNWDLKVELKGLE